MRAVTLSLLFVLLAGAFFYSTRTAALPSKAAPELPTLPVGTVGFIHCRAADFAAAPLLQNVQKQARPELLRSLWKEPADLLGLEPQAIDAFTFALVSSSQRGARVFLPLAIVRARQKVEPRKILERALPQAKAGGVKGMYLDETRREMGAVRFFSDRHYAIGSAETLEAMTGERPAGVTTRPLERALQQIPSHPVVVGFALTGELRQFLLGVLSQESPNDAALRLLSPSLLAIQSATLTVDLEPNLRLDLLATYGDEGEAVRGMRLAHAAILSLQMACRLGRTEMTRANGAHGMTHMPRLLEVVEKNLDDAAVVQQGKNVQVALELKLPAGVAEQALLEAVQRVESASKGLRRANNLRQLALAMHNYHAVYNRMPGDICGPDGQPLLSWRVALLPYLGQDQLFKQFNLDEPWDSPRNKALLEKLPDFYRVPGAVHKDPGTTFYQVFRSAANYRGRYRPMYHAGKDQPSLAQITVKDGVSNTLMIVEAGSAVPWTRPEDITIDQDIEDLSKPAPALGPIPGEPHCYVCFGDASVRALHFLKDPKQYKELLRAVIGMSDGDAADIGPLLGEPSAPGKRPTEPKAAIPDRPLPVDRPPAARRPPNR
jgi:hypothetical protein